MKLPNRLDTGYAEQLRAQLLKAHRDGESVDASDVTYVGGLCFQILLASPVSVTSPSAAFADAMQLLGG